MSWKVLCPHPFPHLWCCQMNKQRDKRKHQRSNKPECLPPLPHESWMSSWPPCLTLKSKAISSPRERRLPLRPRNQPTSWTTCWEACSQTSIDLEYRPWPRVSVELARNPLLDRWWRPWAEHGTLSTLCARTARTRSAPETSLSEMGSHTVRQTTTTCSHPDATTVTDPYWIKLWLLWTRPGIQSTFSVPSVEPFLDQKVSMRRMEKPSAGRTTLTCLPRSVAAVPVPSWRTTSQHSTLCGTLNASFAGSASLHS